MSNGGQATGIPVVAVVGRPNVGKSTFFNRVIGGRVAIVDSRPGVTRDRNFAKADWAGRRFFLVDTGGIIEGSDEPLDRAIREQAYAAVQEADVILFLVDGKAGVHPLDERLAEILRKSGPQVLLVVNKMDNLPNDPGHLDFWSLGMGDPMPVSAISGKGSGDLLDAIVTRLPEHTGTPEDEGVVRVAVVGNPNVGKSSFVNRLFGEERAVVSEIAGTTRDPVDSQMQYHDKTLVFVDTAGLRRQSKVRDSLEYYSALRTAKVVREADVCLVLVDATEPIHVQDLKVVEQALGGGRRRHSGRQQMGPGREGPYGLRPNSKRISVCGLRSSSGCPSCSRRPCRASGSENASTGSSRFRMCGTNASRRRRSIRRSKRSCGTNPRRIAGAAG